MSARILFILLIPLFCSGVLAQCYDPVEDMASYNVNGDEIKYVNLHFHFLDDNQSAGAKYDYTTTQLRARVKQLVEALNYKMSHNQQINHPDPAGGWIPPAVLATRIRFVIVPDINDPRDSDRDGIYIHSISDLELIDGYGIGEIGENTFIRSDAFSYISSNKNNLFHNSSGIDVFFYPLDLDFVDEHKMNNRGQAGNGWLMHEYISGQSENEFYNQSVLLIHELGHVLGLSHTIDTQGATADFDTDYLCDTPYGMPGETRRDNNYMSDGAGSAFSPLQLNKMHENLDENTEIFYRDYLDLESCQPITNNSIIFDPLNIQEGYETMENTTATGELTSISHNIEVGYIELSPNTYLEPNGIYSIEINKKVPSCLVYNYNINTYEDPVLGLRTAGRNIANEEKNNLFTEELALFPNPSDGNFTINLPFDEGENQPELIITNILGKQVYEKSVSYGVNYLQLSGLPKGAYLIKVTTDFNRLEDKIIIQ